MIRIGTFISIILVFLSCSPNLQNAVVMSSNSDNLDFKNLKTYAWLPPNTTVEDLVILSVEEELHNKNYELNTENPDFLVMVHVLKEASGEPVRPPLYNQFEYNGANLYETPFQKYYYSDVITVPIVPAHGMNDGDYVDGTIIVDFIDPKKNEIIWRGTASDERNNAMDVLNDLPSYISLIFQKLPE